MKLIFLLSFLSALIYPFQTFAWDWRDLHDQTLKDWSSQIQLVLEELSKDVPSPRDGYYWYLFGSMKFASAYIESKQVLIAQNQLKKALPTCKKIFLENILMAKKCEQKLDALIKGP